MVDLSQAQFGGSCCNCHPGREMSEGRCTVSGHRMKINGVPARSTKDIILKDRNPGYLITELKGRRAAKKAGKQL